MATKKFELLAKHVKSLQFVIAIACWAVVIEKDQTNEKGLYSLLEKLYLGDVNDDDTIAMHESFYDGEGRFQYMYEDQKGEKFALCFGPVIGGLSKRHFREYLDAKTVKTKNSKLVGRDIKLKADKALLEGKKYLAYWNEFLGKDGKFPSGKNEDDAMNRRRRSWHLQQQSRTPCSCVMVAFPTAAPLGWTSYIFVVLSQLPTAIRSCCGEKDMLVIPSVGDWATSKSFGVVFILQVPR